MSFFKEGVPHGDRTAHTEFIRLEGDHGGAL